MKDVYVRRFYIFDDGAIREWCMSSCRFSEEERRIRVHQKAVRVVVGPLQECELKGFLMRTRELVEWKCITLLVSYCYVIPEAEYMLVLRHDVAVMRPCFTCFLEKILSVVR